MEITDEEINALHEGFKQGYLVLLEVLELIESGRAQAAADKVREILAIVEGDPDER